MSASTPDRQTILFSGHDLRFLRPFTEHCQANPRYRVFFEQQENHAITNEQRCRELLPLADIIFCEWCLGNAVWYAANKLPRQRLLVRLHLQEMRLPYLDRIQWGNVDALILICPLNLKEIRDRYPFLTQKTHLIYNPIDCDALNQSKLPGAEFNLGLMGISPMRKAPHVALQIFARLKKIDRRYTLFVKGKHPRDYAWLWRRPEERQYYEKLFADIESSPWSNSVVFETYGDDVPLWFSKIGFILSTSDFEGSHQSIAEGMASGAIPVIRDWAGADQLYPRKYVFSGIERAAEAVLKWRTPAIYQEQTDFCRAHARKHFDQRAVCTEIEALFNLGHRVSQPPVVVRSSTSEPGAVAPPVLMLAYIPVGFRGGYRIRVEQEIRSLVKHGCAVHLACLHPHQADTAARQAHFAELAALGCTVHAIPMDRFFDVKIDETIAHEALAALQSIAQQYHLQILHAEALYCARLGLLLKERWPQVCLVFDCHGTTPEEERLSGAHPSRISAMEQWEHRVLTTADLNVFVSEAMNAFYRDRYALNGTPRVIVPCCVAEQRFAGKKPAGFLTGLPTKRPILVYLGTMAAWQCGGEMIRLFAQLHCADPQVFFLMLMPKADQAKTRELMREHKLPANAVLLTELPHDQVANVLSHAHAGVLLRRAHPVNRVSSPTKFGEYLAAGIPVIMTDGIGDFSDLAAHRGVGIVLQSRLLDLPQYSEAEISHILKFIHESKGRSQQVRAQCQAVARECLDWQASTVNLLEQYHQLLDRQPASGKAAIVSFTSG